MAYKIILNKRFVIKSGKIAAWIEQEWSKVTAEKFVKELYLKIESLKQTPFAGMPSAKKSDYRKLIISKHNKLYYRMKGKTIYIVDWIESKQDPQKNQYE